MWFQMQVSVAYSSFLPVLVMIYTGFIVENDPTNGISMNEEEHKLVRASSTVRFSLTKLGSC
jgi:hypothetical protein